MVTVRVDDGTGYLELAFFNQPWAARTYREGMEVAVSGVVGLYRRMLQMQNQEVEVLRGEGVETVHTGRGPPGHPATGGGATRASREVGFRALPALEKIEAPMPAGIARAEKLESYDWAVRKIHFPEDAGELARAQERLTFDELFALELGVAFR